MEHFEAESDSHAIDHAVRRYRSSIGRSFEIWQKIGGFTGGQRIATDTKDPTPREVDQVR